MKKLWGILFLVTVVVVLTGCATLFSQSTYPVSITSNPEKAKITITNMQNVVIYQGVAPAVVNLTAGDGFFKAASYIVTFSKPGYDDSIYNLKSNLDGWFWGNLLLGGVVGMLIVDPATGAMWKLDPHVSVNMIPQNSVSSLSIMDINEIPQKWKEHLIKIG
jgi:hypothetical protein